MLKSEPESTRNECSRLSTPTGTWKTAAEFSDGLGRFSETVLLGRFPSRCGIVDKEVNIALRVARNAGGTNEVLADQSYFVVGGT